MAKGDVTRLQYHRYQDNDTGTHVTRLTPVDVICQRNYFYQKCFSKDGKRLIFGGEFDGRRNYFLLDIAAAEAHQLTDQSHENTFGGFLSPDDRFLYFVRNERTLVRLALDTFAEETVYSSPADWVSYGTWVANSDCTKMVGIEIHKDDWFPLTDWQKFRDMFYAKPRCRLIRIDLRTGAMNVIHEEKLWLGHPQYRPFDDNTVAYCHEGPNELIDARMWFVNENGTNIRCGHVHMQDESCTHEFWVPDGSRMVYVSFFRTGNERWIRSVDPITLDEKALLKIPKCSHLMSNYDGSLIVGDGSGEPLSSGKPVSNEKDPYLYLFDVGRGTYRPLARHDTSWEVIDGDRQVTHPHPSFSPDDKKVLYTSDVHGKPALYLADVAR